MNVNDVARGRVPTVVVSGAMILDLLGLYPNDFDQYDWNNTPQSVAFNAIPSLTYLAESSGGCAANIAYNLALLEVHSLLVSTVGGDFPQTHCTNLKRVGVDLSGLKVLGPEITTPRSVTLTDRSGRQFTFWAANGVGPNNSPSLDDYCCEHAPELVVVASNLSAIMLDQLNAASTYQTKLLWAPGIDICSLTQEELQAAWAISNYIVVNEAEWQWARNILGVENPEWSPRLQAVVVTCAARGCIIYQDKQAPIVLPAIAPERIVDPTGCGDAFVAGLAYGLTSDLDLLTCARIGASMSSFNLESRGTQHHACTAAQVRDRLRMFYGDERSK